MKNAVIIVAGTGQHHDVQVEPGTTAGDVLSQVGLNGYVLSKDNGAHVFGNTENIYPDIDDGEKLHAASKTDVGTPSHVRAS